MVWLTIQNKGLGVAWSPMFCIVVGVIIVFGG